MIRVTLYVLPVLSYDPREDILHAVHFRLQWDTEQIRSNLRKIMRFPDILVLHVDGD